MNLEWVPAFELDQVPVGGSKVFKREDRQIAVFRLDEATVYAIDNQCPHEGYPLAQGYVRDCVLTCAWHNYKFDLRDGACLIGDEAVRSWPVRIVDQTIEIDVAEPDPAREIPKLLASLEEGLLDWAMGRAARDVVRLLKAGYPPELLLLEAARFDAERAEYGTTHALPVACDALRYLPRYPGLEAAGPIVVALDVAAEPSVRRPRRKTPAAIDPGPDPVAAGERLRALVEQEDAAGAEGLVRGALEAGWGPEVLEPWFYHLCAAHFLDFGHALIRQVKIFDLLKRVGWTHALELLPALVFNIVNGTREDTLPAWAGFRKRYEAIVAELPELYARQAALRTDAAERGRDRGAALAAAPDADLAAELEAARAAKWAAQWAAQLEPVLTAVLEGDRAEMFGAVLEALRQQVPAVHILDTLSVAAAQRLFSFDVGIAASIEVQDDWLDVTHLVTFCNAVRHALDRFLEPEVLRLVFFAARMVHNARPLELPAEKRCSLEPLPDEGLPAERVGRILAAMTAHQAGIAVRLTMGYLADRQPMGPLWTALEDLGLRDPAVRPIVVAHVIKTTFAAREEFEALAGHPGQAYPLVAVVRWLSSPVHERSLRRQIHEAIQFVGQGKIPRRLTD